jgi:hypothetical protein
LVKAEPPAELGKKSCLSLVAQAIGVADSDGQFERQLPRLRSGKNGYQTFQGHPPLQHLREHPGEVEFTTERAGNATPLGALALSVRPSASAAISAIAMMARAFVSSMMKSSGPASHSRRYSAAHDGIRVGGLVPAGTLVSPATCGWHRLKTNAASSP